MSRARYYVSSFIFLLQWIYNSVLYFLRKQCVNAGWISLDKSTGKCTGKVKQDMGLVHSLAKFIVIHNLLSISISVKFILLLIDPWVYCLVLYCSPGFNRIFEWFVGLNRTTEEWGSDLAVSWEEVFVFALLSLESDCGCTFQVSVFDTTLHFRSIFGHCRTNFGYFIFH